MMPTPPSHGYPPAPPPKPNRLPIILAIVAGVALLLVCGVGGVTAAYFVGRGDADETGGETKRYTASELAKRALDGCTAPEPIQNPTGGALERVNCDTTTSDAVVSTYPDEATALTDAQSLVDFMAGYDLENPGILVGPYWTVNCSQRADCEVAQDKLGGRILE